MTTRSAAYEQYKNDYQFMNGIETVTVTDGTNTTTTVKAKRTGLTKREVQQGSSLGFSAHDIAWVIWTATLGDVVMAPECILTDVNDVSYTLVQVGFQLWDTQWRCPSVKQK